MSFIDRVLNRAVGEASESALVWYRDARSPAETSSWGELCGRVVHYRSQLAARVPARALVPIMGPSSPDLISVFLAVLSLGGVPALFPPGSPRQDPAYFAKQQSAALAALGPGLVIGVEMDTSKLAAEGLGGIVEIRSGAVSAARAPSGFRGRRLPEGVLFVQHSSGTTGMKKGIPFTERKLELQLATYRSAIAENGRKPKIASWLPLYHDMGFVSNLLLSLFDGLTLVFTDPFVWIDHPPLLFRMIAEQRATHVWLPNFAFRHLVRFFPRGCPYDLSSVEAWINCSEPCKLEIMREFAAKFAPNGVSWRSIKCCYAMAETIFAVSQTPLDGEVWAVPLAGAAVRPGAPPLIAKDSGSAHQYAASNGPPLPGVEVRILHQDRFLDPGLTGEICIRAPFMFDGYVGREDEGLFKDGFYRTGDIGFIHEGEIFILGRSKDVIIINGQNFLAHEIELALAGVPGLRPGRIVAFGLYSERIGSEELFILAEADGGPAQVTAARVREVVYRDFGLTCRDVRLVTDRWLVKSSSGKISRDANRDKYLASFAQTEPA